MSRIRPQAAFWRRLHLWAVNNFPPFLVPISMFFAALPFYLLWRSGRRRLIRNLELIFGRQPLRNFARGMRVVYNFSWTMTDTWLFTEQRAQVDWEFEGLEHFESLIAHPGGVVILTAHMGNYDLGAYFFAEKAGRPLSIVRIPEQDENSEKLARERRERTATPSLSVTYSDSPDIAAISLLDRLRNGETVAIQGDRIYPGLATTAATLFDQSCRLPVGPFELALVTRAPLYPLFVVRNGIYRYRVIAHPPIEVRRTGRDRSEAVGKAMNTWTEVLERVLERWWHQWAAFEEIAP